VDGFDYALQLDRAVPPALGLEKRTSRLTDTNFFSRRKQIWRRWHRRVNIKEKRYAVCSALAASAVPSLLLARGHRVEGVPEVPLVVDDSAADIKKTAKAVELLKQIGAYADVEKVKASRNVRTGKGKMRNRRYVQRRGPLVVYAEDNGVTRAFRNIPGVELCSVDRLGLLTLAPGGHVGRFIIWTKSAFEKLDSIFGTAAKKSSSKKGWKPPTNIMAQTDLARVINSDEIQSAINAPKVGATRAHAPLKRNPLKNKSAMERLNPYAKVAREMQARAQEERSKAKAAKANAARSAVGQKFYESMKVDSNYEGELFDEFNDWLTRKPPVKQTDDN
jgi:large subunit ribosomal protein L4e